MIGELDGENGEILLLRMERKATRRELSKKPAQTLTPNNSLPSRIASQADVFQESRPCKKLEAMSRSDATSCSPSPKVDTSDEKPSSLFASASKKPEVDRATCLH